ncbi:hypothetical protein AcW2_000066 [Taiwanofungus camphoratus]|nr:hypothetical protein AcW2_000066 [Antrodia cinnamomea]
MVSQVSDIANKTFDYIVIGGGTAGLTVASRLVEDPDKSVLVLEAGQPNLNDPKILYGGGFGSTFGDAKYDWGHTTVPQKHCNNRAMVWNRGKGLGGSSHMNFYAWIKPPAADIDAVEELGNPGWNWEMYKKYTERAEEFTAATEEQLKEYEHTHNLEYRGTSGPIKTTVPDTADTLNQMFVDVLQKKGVSLLKDPYGGDITGCWIASANLDRKAQWTRSYAATAYYLPNKDKPNFKVLTDAVGARILFSDEMAGNDYIANGVEFVHNGKRYTAHARKEVICAAGTIKSPQLLELSGVGRPDVLKKIGVPLKIELLGVGENVQDHTFSGVSFELDRKVDHKTLDVFRDAVLAKEQTKLQWASFPACNLDSEPECHPFISYRELDQHNRHRLGITGFSYLPISVTHPKEAPSIIDGVTAYIKAQKKGGKVPPELAEQYDIQLRVLKDKSLPDMEFIVFPGYMTFASAPEDGKTYFTMLLVSNHPFSRGTIHAKSNDPLDDPDIDPHIFENPYDLEIFAEHVTFIRSIANAEPLKSSIIREVNPGPEAKTLDQIKEYLKNYCSTTFHAIGSLSMLPREKNGVVDPELRVYGTKNLRIADLSVVPLHFAAHTQATAYAIGERLADILKGSP